MIRLLINTVLILLLISCKITNPNKVTEIINEKKDNIQQVISEKKKKITTKKNISSNELQLNYNGIKYVLGEPYFIEGVKYTPEENYNYEEIGLASFYGKELHNKKTVNNDLNKVTELLGRHKTLPIPSIVKVTNLDNGLSIILKINDRHNDNSVLLQVSRKTAQLLKFYKPKIAKVKIEILSDPSKQMKIVTQSMSESSFDTTIESAPTENVLITNIDEDINENDKIDKLEQPIQLGFEEITDKELYLKVYDFNSYEKAKSTILELDISNKFTTKKEENNYSLIIGPLTNIDANNLLLSFISKGYNTTEFILK